MARKLRVEYEGAVYHVLNRGDRREAIRTAVTGLQAGDLLVIAGKGHETGQIVGATVHHFDDSEEARAAVLAADGRLS